MLHISESQELTLYRWANAHRTRPGVSDKEFLLAEKGLTSEQIDAWWDRWESTSQTGILTGPESSNGFGLPSQSEHLSYVAAGSDTQFNEQSMDTSYLIPSLSGQDAHISLSTSYTDVTPRSDRSSTATSNSAFSQTSWDHVHVSNRSSDISFATSNSRLSHSRNTSTSSSFQNLTMVEEVESSQIEEYVNPVDLNLTIRPGISSDWIQNKPEAPLPLFTDISLPITAPPSANDYNTQPVLSNANPPKNHTNFACTTCHLLFPSKKHDWKRHESSQCDPQTSWICMLDGPATLTSSSSTFGQVPGSCTYTCAFCPAMLPRDEMNQHHATAHNTSTCLRRPSSHPQRVFQRKDKLKHHLMKKHGLPQGAEGVWETWSRPVQPAKKAWGCGFCGSCTFTWEGRLEHVARHFEKEGLEVRNWSMDLEIKGLLRQTKDNHEAWKMLLERNGIDERLVRWERHVGLEIKQNLEYGTRKLKEIAEDALREAVSTKGHPESTSEMAASLLTGNRMTVWPTAMVRPSVSAISHSHQHSLGSNRPLNGQNRLGDWEMNDETMI